MAEEQEEEPQIACTIKMKSISSFFKSPVAIPDKKIPTKPKEFAPSAKSSSGAGYFAKLEKCQNGNQSKGVEKRRVNGLVVGCKGDSNETPGDCVTELKSDRQKTGFGKKQTTDCLNSSLDEFQSPPQKPVNRTKKRSRKPNCKQKADVSSSQDERSKKRAKLSDEVPPEECESKEESESVSEISYEDFLRESGNISNEVIDKSGSADDTGQAEDGSEDAKCFTEGKSATNGNVDDVIDKKESRKLRARQNRAAKETRKPSTSEGELTDDEKPKAPVANIMNYFAATSRKSDVKVTSADDVVVFIKAEVHCPPSSSEPKVFNIFSPKQKNSCVEDTPEVDQLENKTSTSGVAKTTARKRSSNVIVESTDVDLSITELESPFGEEESGKSSSPTVRIGSSKQEKVKVGPKSKKTAEDARIAKKRTKVKESECTKKSPSNRAEDTSCKDGAVTDSTVLQDMTSNVTKSDKNATKSDKNATKSDTNATKSDKNATKSDMNATMSDNNATKSDKNATQSDKSATKSDKNATKSDKNATKSDNNATKSNTNATKSDKNATKSDKNVTKFDNNVTKSDKNATKSDNNATKSDKNATMSDKNATKSDKNATKSDKNATKSDKNASKSDKNATMSDKNATKSDKNATKSDKNATKSDKNATKSDKNATKSDKNATKSDKNATMSDKNATKSDKNATKSDKNATKSYKDSDMTADAVTIERDALETRKCSAAVKIASLQSIDTPTGRSRTQMTLNFSHRKDDGSVLQKPLELRKNKKVTRQRKRSNSKKVSEETTQVDVIVKEVKTDRRKGHHESKVSKSECGSVSNDSELVAAGTTPGEGTVSTTPGEGTVSTTPGEGTVSEDVYKSTIVETGCQKKKTPIKLKITRIPRTSTRFEDPRKQQKLAKLSRAQQLLVRAKTKNGKKPTRFTSSRSCEGDALRRSSRRSSMAAKSAIMLCYEGAMWNEQQTAGDATDKNEMPHSKRTRGKSETLIEKKENESSVSKRNAIKTSSKTLAGKTSLTSVPKGSASKSKTKAPVKGSHGDSRKASKSAAKVTEVGEKRKLTKKSSRAKGNQSAETTKLAAIFHTPKTGRDSPVVVSDASNDSTEVNIERRQFLLSGVPEELQKRLVQTVEVDTVNHPPWPSVSHVQQAEICDGQEAVSDVLDVWNLPSDSLNVRQRNEDETAVCVPGKWQSGSFMETPESEDKFTNMSEARSRPTFNSETVSWLLAETMTHNPSYPAVRMYRHLTKRRLAAENTSTESKTTVSNGTQENKTGCSKRKLENLSGETGSSHKNKKSRSSRHHKVDQEGDHKEDHKRDRKGDHKGDHIGDCKVDRKLDHKGDHKDDPTPNGAREKISGGISQQKTENKKKSCPQPADEGTNTVKSSSESTAKAKDKVGSSSLWTDKYAPVTSACVLGNPGCVGKLKTWLKEWKIVTDRQAKMEARERKKQQKKDGETKPAGKDDSDWWSDDDDFNLGGGGRHGDSDCDEDLLCNTMVVTGPHGVGKTAMVYAVAHELGYKVFEVNASSQRSGRQVLAQLQEATQSHQVSKKNLPDLMSVMSKMAAVPSSSAKKETKKKLPPAFANLFAKAAKTTKSDDVSITSVEKAGGKKEKTNKRKENTSKPTCQSDDVTIVEKAGGKKEKMEKRKENKGAVNKKPTSGNEGTKKAEAKSCDGEMKNEKRSESESKKEENTSTGLSDCSKQALDLSSTSVILFEEVDIVFEDDKGFWAAIQTFIETTKRPIILTSTVDQFIAAESERLTLTVPPLMNIASHLQTVCLAENVRTEFSNLLSLVEYLHGDIRRCLLTLQFWVDSGACSNPVPKDVLFISKHCKSVKQSDENIRGKSDKDIVGQNHMELKSCEEGGMKVASIDTSQRNGITEEEDVSSVDSIPPSTAKSSTSADIQIDDAERTLRAAKPLVTPGGESECTTVLGHAAPPIHGRCFESVLGPSMSCHGDPLQDSVLQMLSDVGSSTSVRRGIRLVRHYRQQGIGLLYANLPRLLPCSASLPATDLDEMPQEPKPLPKTDVAKTTYVDKLYDSEKSDEEDGTEKTFLSLPTAKRAEESQLVVASTRGCRKTKMCKRARELVLRSLDCMSELHDDLSFLDSSFGGSSAGVTDNDDTRGSHHRCRTLPGLSDDVGGAESEVSQNWWADSCVEDVCSMVNMYSFKRTRDTLAGILGEVESLEDLGRRLVGRSLWTSVAEQSCNPKIRRETDEEVRNCRCAHKARENVASHLPVGVQTHRAVSMDYMPSIRTICRSEQHREASHVKRRFLHYLDQHQMGLKSSSITELYSSFT